MHVCIGTRPRKHLVFCLLETFKWIFSSVKIPLCFCTQSELLHGSVCVLFLVGCEEQLWFNALNLLWVLPCCPGGRVSRHSIFSAKSILCKICSNCRAQYLLQEIQSGQDEPTLHFQNDAEHFFFFFHTCVKVILGVSVLAELQGFQMLHCHGLYVVSW